MSNFDPTVFLDAVTTESFTKRNLAPIGDYIATIGEMKVQSGQQKKDTSKSWTALNIPLEVDLTANPAARAVVGQDKIVVFDFVGLDLTESGSLDQSPGRNSRLRAYREALGMNEAGQPFSPRMMQGRMVKIKVAHEQNDPAFDAREKVAGVTKVG